MCVLNSIEIVGLFGHYSYRIPLISAGRTDRDDDVEVGISSTWFGKLECRFSGKD